MQGRKKKVSAVLGAGNMKFNIVNEIKLSYPRKGNCERSISSSNDTVDVFRQHFDAEEMDYRESFLALYLNQANKVLGIKKISECLNEPTEPFLILQINNMPILLI